MLLCYYPVNFTKPKENNRKDTKWKKKQNHIDFNFYIINRFLNLVKNKTFRTWVTEAEVDLNMYDVMCNHTWHHTYMYVILVHSHRMTLYVWFYMYNDCLHVWHYMYSTCMMTHDGSLHVWNYMYDDILHVCVLNQLLYVINPLISSVFTCFMCEPLQILMNYK